MDIEFKESGLSKMRREGQDDQTIRFYSKLCNMTERVKIFNDLFCNKRTFFDEQFAKRKMLSQLETSDQTASSVSPNKYSKKLKAKINVCKASPENSAQKACEL